MLLVTLVSFTTLKITHKDFYKDMYYNLLVFIKPCFSVIRLHALRFVPLKKEILSSQPIGIVFL